MHMMKLRFILVAVCVVCFHGEFYEDVFFFCLQTVNYESATRWDFQVFVTRKRMAKFILLYVYVY